MANQQHFGQQDEAAGSPDGVKAYRRDSKTPLPLEPLPSNTNTPQLSRRDPSIPVTSTTSKPPFDPEHNENAPDPWSKTCMKFLYDGDNGTVCGRTCSSWFFIITYAIMYLIFLATYTMMFLYFTLLMVKTKNFEKFPDDNMFSLLTYSPDSVELTGVPLAEHNYPLIWYRNGVTDEYDKYVTALDELFEKKRAKRDLDFKLGPCGHRPYGYGEKPCILVKITKQFNWAGKPLEAGSPKAKKAPEEVQKWIEKDSKKYWLYCSGYHDYDKEHVGKIKYYPDPPGFDSSLYPLAMNSTSPVVAFQVTNFTLGISLIIECKLWFDGGSTTSTFAFMLYVSPK